MPFSLLRQQLSVENRLPDVSAVNHYANRKNTIYPVILPVPDNRKNLSGRGKVAFLSRHARSALALSASISQASITELEKDESGAPVPSNGYYWSLTHKSDFVAAVTSRSMIGIDVEKIRPCSASLFRKTAKEEEWRLSDTDRRFLFFRFWTSKEAVLKAAGTGLRDLACCRVVNVPDQYHLVVHYNDTDWLIEHRWFDGHIASIVANDCHIEWVFA